MSSSHQRNKFRSSRVLLIPILIFGCAEGYVNPQTGLGAGSDDPQGVIGVSDANGPGGALGAISPCEEISLDSPLAESVLSSTQVQVKGSVVPKAGVPTQFIRVDQEVVPLRNGQFDVTIQRPSGSHTIVVSCSDHQVERSFTVDPGAMRIVVTSPETASFVSSATSTINVSGYVENYQAGAVVTLNGMSIQVDPSGQFQAGYTPHLGLNHLDLVAELEGQGVDARQSILYGQLSPFGDDPQSKIALEIRQSAFQKLSSAIEQNLTDDVLEELLAPNMGRNGDIELHEIRYDRLELDFTPQRGRVRVQLKLHNFGIKVTYHYFAGRIRGWANVATAQIELDLKIPLTSDHQYDLELENPIVDLQGFDLDLDDIYSIAEGIVEPMVLDFGRKALVDVLDTLVIEELINADLLSQTIDFLGYQTTLDLALTELDLSPEGITALAQANIDPFPAVKNLPGIWTAGSNMRPDGGAGDATVGMSVDLFNRLAAHAVRGGLLDQDLATLLGEDQSASRGLSMGIIANLAQPDLLSTFPVTAPVSIRTEALMQPVLQVVTSPSVGLSAALGGLRLHLSSPDQTGEEITWAVLELSGILNIYPTFENGEFRLSIDLSPRVEVVEAPLMPLHENAFENFLETMLTGLSEGVLNDLATDAFNFSSIDLFGIGLTDARLNFDANHPDFLNFAVDVGAR